MAVSYERGTPVKRERASEKERSEKSFTEASQCAVKQRIRFNKYSNQLDRGQHFLCAFPHHPLEHLPHTILQLGRKVDVRLPGKRNSDAHGARPVHLIITIIKWIRTSRLPIKNSLSSSTE